MECESTIYEYIAANMEGGGKEGGGEYSQSQHDINSMLSLAGLNSDSKTAHQLEEVVYQWLASGTWLQATTNS